MIGSSLQFCADRVTYPKRADISAVPAARIIPRDTMRGVKMKQIDISTPKYPNTYALVDDIDYDNVMRFSWTLHVRRGFPYVHCKMNMGRISGRVQNCAMHLHRYILRPPYNMDVDHHNHNGLDCRRSNIRICTTAQNICNQLLRGGSSKYKGVSWHKQGKFWVAGIKSNGKRQHLGSFHNELEAAKAYDEKALELFGEFALTNEEILSVSMVRGWDVSPPNKDAAEEKL